MSSTEYSAALQPDPRLRRIVAGSGLLLGFVGALLILQLPVDPWPRLLAGLLWVGSSLREHRQLQRGWAGCCGIRFSADGEITVLAPHGTWRPAHRVAGGVLLRKCGWIRLRDDRGVVFGEPVSGDDRNCPDWRRLQVIWRHVGARQLSC